MRILPRSASHFALLCLLLPVSRLPIASAQSHHATPVPRLRSSTAQQARAFPEAAAIGAAIDTAISEGRLPGAVVLLGHQGHIVFRHAYGMRSLEPAPEPMTEDTVFDMASLTKPLVTALAVAQLVEQGKLVLDNPVATYLPAFAANGKGDITLRDLLTHYSGLPADLDLTSPWLGKQEGYRLAMNAHPVRPPGVEFRYSDINYITLGAVVEQVSGLPLAQYAARYIAAPLGLRDTRFLPPASQQPRIAPTQYDEHHSMLRGTVHDPTSRRMGGVAGHAGLFSTADDLATYAQSLLDRRAGRPSRFPLSRRMLLKMTTPASPATATALRGLGWDIDSPFSSNRGVLFPVGSFGHTGFTGTSLWIDPASDSYVVLLANAVYPDGGKSIVALRSTVATLAAEALKVQPDAGALAALLTGYNESLSGQRRRPDRTADVLAGIDVLAAQHFAPLAALAASHHGELRVGLLTNQTGLDRSGRRTIDILAQDAPAAVPGLRLTTLFSPEHGLEGVLDTASIRDATDAATGVPVVSLYGTGDRERRPPLDRLRQLDVLVIDLQDVGVRFYTYEAALRYFLEAAANTRTPMLVLDRPNPLGGSFVQGPISDAGADSYVDVAPLPVRHGLTLGELARWLNGELHLGAPLTVVAMEGWQRGDWFDATGLSWTNPSPNLRSLTAAILYPGLGLIETTNLSVGRGTATPFEILGAPWIDSRVLAAKMNSRDLPGVRFVPVSFTPDAPYPYAGQLCHGVNILVTARDQLDAPALGLELATALHQLYPQAFHLNAIATLLADRAVLDQLEAGVAPQRMEEGWQASLDAYLEKRKPYLLY